jgi:hypothetical protein
VTGSGIEQRGNKNNHTFGNKNIHEMQTVFPSAFSGPVPCLPPPFTGTSGSGGRL